MDVVEQALWQALAFFERESQKDQLPPRFVVAYSGGKDSHVLLHALSRLQHRFKVQHPFQIQAFHVHHGLSAYACEWAKHCEMICDELQIPLEIFHVKIDLKNKESLEALAREARYRVFRQALQVNDRLLTAHTQEDQAETVLMHLLRGTGLQGLAGIHSKHPMGRSWLIRPLLGINREQIFNYAKQHQLKWIEDDSNENLAFRRNLIRHTVFPLLHTINPRFAKQFSSCARLAYEAQTLLEEYLLADFAEMVDVKGRLIVNVFLQHSDTKQKALLRCWIKQQKAVLPSEKKLSELLRQMLNAKDDKMPCVAWGNHEIRRYQGKLYLMTSCEPNSRCIDGETLQWDYHHPLVLKNNQQWRAESVLGERGIDRRLLKSLTFEVRFRQFGERIKLPGKSHHTKLKTLFQLLHIPPWERDEIPLFYQEGDLVAIGDYWVSEKYLNLNPSQIGLVIKRLVK